MHNKQERSQQLLQKRIKTKGETDVEFQDILHVWNTILEENGIRINKGRIKVIVTVVVIQEKV